MFNEYVFIFACMFNGWKSERMNWIFTYCWGGVSPKDFARAFSILNRVLAYKFPIVIYCLLCLTVNLLIGLFEMKSGRRLCNFASYQTFHPEFWLDSLCKWMCGKIFRLFSMHTQNYSLKAWVGKWLRSWYLYDWNSYLNPRVTK